MECLSLTVDDPSSVEACYEEVKKLVGDKGLDYLFNNAGRSIYPVSSSLKKAYWRAPRLDYTVPALDIDVKEVEATFATNVVAVIHINAVFSPLILRAHGTYIHTGSVAGVFPYVWGSVYNASKAALAAYCNTLRVEMAPFDVKVINIITGGVRSNIARTDRVLPPNSVFKPIESSYERRLKHSQEVGMDTDVYAKGVMDEILRGQGWRWWDKSEIWAGAAATLIWVATRIDPYVPGGVMGPVVSRMFGLGALKSGQVKKVAWDRVVDCGEWIIMIQDDVRYTYWFR
jgi:1-acylglycerone phosphate reductase